MLGLEFENGFEMGEGIGVEFNLRQLFITELSAHEHFNTYLVDDRLILGSIQDSFEVLRPEVAHSDTLEFTLVLELFEDLPQFLQVSLTAGCDERVVNEV